MQPEIAFPSIIFSLHFYHFLLLRTSSYAIADRRRQLESLHKERDNIINTEEKAP